MHSSSGLDLFGGNEADGVIGYHDSGGSLIAGSITASQAGRMTIDVTAVVVAALASNYEWVSFEFRNEERGLGGTISMSEDYAPVQGVDNRPRLLVDAVPEPATMTALLGSIGILMLRRKRD